MNYVIQRAYIVGLAFFIVGSISAMQLDNLLTNTKDEEDATGMILDLNMPVSDHMKGFINRSDYFGMDEFIKRYPDTVNSVDRNESTILEYAIKNWDGKAVEILVDNGAVCSKVDNIEGLRGRTHPLQAVVNGLGAGYGQTEARWQAAREMVKIIGSRSDSDVLTDAIDKVKKIQCDAGVKTSYDVHIVKPLQTIAKQKKAGSKTQKRQKTMQQEQAQKQQEEAVAQNKRKADNDARAKRVLKRSRGVELRNSQNDMPQKAVATIIPQEAIIVNEFPVSLGYGSDENCPVSLGYNHEEKHHFGLIGYNKEV